MEKINVYTVKMVKEKEVPYDIASKSITSPKTAARLVNLIFDLENEPIENFGIFCLNRKNKIIGAHLLHKGSTISAIVSTKTIFQHALLNNATAIICFHNHPSGNPEPSDEDICFTKMLYEASEVMDIELLDHIIIGHDEKFASLKDLGYIKR